MPRVEPMGLEARPRGRLVGEQLSRRHVKCLRHSHDMKHRAVANTALDATHVAAPNRRAVGKRFLRELSFQAKGADADAQLPECSMFRDFSRLGRHTRDAGASHPFGPRPIGYNDCGRRPLRVLVTDLVTRVTHLCLQAATGWNSIHQDLEGTDVEL